MRMQSILECLDYVRHMQVTYGFSVYQKGSPDFGKISFSCTCVQGLGTRNREVEGFNCRRQPFLILAPQKLCHEVR